MYSCIHRFNPDSFGDSMWEEIHVRLKTMGGPDLQQLYPQFTGVRPLSATMVECSGSTFVFSEQEAGEEVFICIHKRKHDCSGDDLWEEVMRRKRKRHRAPNWKAEEITLFLKAKVQALEAVKGKPDWEYISESLERAGFNRGPQACEDVWGTQLKRLTDIQKYVQENKISGTSSSWVSIWNMTENERSEHNLPRVFTLEWYEMMQRIHGRKPRKKIARGKKKQVDGKASTSFHNDSSVTSAHSSGLMTVNFPASSLALPTSTSPLSTESFDNFEVGDEDQHEVQRRGSTDLTSQVSSLHAFLLQGRQNLTNNQIAKKKDEAVKILRSNLQLEILKEKNKLARDCANRRRSKSRKTNA
ncbi:hypothetical protein KC19_1G064000 [Ceratodon purpureus]|uniref:Myb-like domain-containing protein n=1 Tax=Ceratodon purpureus TaxID=3225 RepID=A0A8T0J472_CERPU|nr:hypothetical protein KC19_1G064000 [Ceratodon purpureus]